MADSGELYLGLISGTSMDGIDAALVRLGDRRCDTVETHSHAYTDALRERLIEASRRPEKTTIDEAARLDHAVGLAFRDAALALLAKSGTPASQVRAIGSHGQTLRHLPRDAEPFTLQAGDPNLIATGTGITTVADFRRRDLALGGEGAPLAPGFHEWVFGGSGTDRIVLNIGGIANVTVLPGDNGGVLGFDTGPGNTLLDAWVRHNGRGAFDRDGAWAARSDADADLLNTLLADPYFDRPPPKSTGFEYFNLSWIEASLPPTPPSPDVVQATLLELTVESIRRAVETSAPATREVFVCGGGVHNAAMMRRLTASLAPLRVASTSELGVDPDWVEAALFAWLASRSLAGRAGNLPGVTGARAPEILGGIYRCLDAQA